ncbi:MAG TPA: DUF416 family protein [Burkholderiaceae bacterium]|nr:DUF416 family protein [Burkholderiaceae bacterium]
MTTLHHFDETQLSDDLSKLPAMSRMAFAAAVASRPLGTCERFAAPLGLAHGGRPREIAGQLWGALQGDSSERTTWVMALEEVMNLLPPATEPASFAHGLVDDALSSLVYAIRCLLTPEADEAAWAARCAYESIGRAALRVLSVPAGTPQVEAQVLAHPWVQRELERQRRDLEALLADRSDAAIHALRQRVSAEELLTAEEGLTLS